MPSKRNDACVASLCSLVALMSRDEMNRGRVFRSFRTYIRSVALSLCNGESSHLMASSDIPFVCPHHFGASLVPKPDLGVPALDKESERRKNRKLYF